MAQFGLGNFLYEIEVTDGGAKFHFFDNDDASNTADVTVAAKDFPEGAPATSRQVADLAFSQCSKVLNDKRSTRLRKEEAEATDARLTEESRVREAGEDFHNNAQDVAVEPVKVEDDGTKVYNTGTPDAKSDGSDKKK